MKLLRITIIIRIIRIILIILAINNRNHTNNNNNNCNNNSNENNNNQSTMVQASKPQVSAAEIKLTQAPMPFIRTIENQYLSISPRNNKLPPEIARMIQ